MKLFTAMESYQPHYEGTEEEVNALLESICDQQIETAMMLETYSDTTEALKNLKRVEKTRVIDRGVYGVTMESLADQFGYPEGVTFTSESIGESISRFAKKVWEKIVAAWHAVRDWIRKLFGMSPIPSLAQMEEAERNIQEAAERTKKPDPVVEEVVNEIDMNKTNREIAEQHDKNLAEILDNGNLMEVLKRERNINSVAINKLFKNATDHLDKEEMYRVALPVLVHATVNSKYEKYSDDEMANLYNDSSFEALKRVFKDTGKGISNKEEVTLRLQGATIKTYDGKVKSEEISRNVDVIISETARGTPEILHKQILWLKRAAENVGDLLSHAVDGAFDDEETKLKFGKDVGYEIELLTYKLISFREIIKRRDEVSRAVKGEVDPLVVLSHETVEL